MDKAWDEIHHGADLRIPGAYRFIMKFVTPVFLVVILISWFFKDGLPVIMMKNVSFADKPFILGTRISLLILFTVLSVLVKIAWDKKKKRPRK